jgi:hypothetical protein
VMTGAVVSVTTWTQTSRLSLALPVPACIENLNRPW